MIFRQLLNDDLSCASYLIGDAGEAAVVDPALEIEPYLALARTHRLTIRHVLDTHLHADHVSGRNRLVAATGATAYLPPQTGAAGRYRVLCDGDVVRAGGVEIETIAAPGHRPEHVSFLVTDTERSWEPCLLLSGDSLLVGDVARPDLAADGDEVEQAARALFHSLHRLSGLPDHVEVWPGHVGGSRGGGAGVTGQISSTIGFERLTNPGFALADEEEFGAALVGRLPERPATVDLVVRMNQRLAAPPPETIAALMPRQALALLEGGGVVVDGRSADRFDAASIPGSLSIPLEMLGVGSRAAWSIDPQEAIITVAEDDDDAREIAARLFAVGLANVKGFLRGGLDWWQAAGLPLASTAQIDLAGLARLIAEDSVTVVDVRDQNEFEAAHVRGSLHLPWQDIRARCDEALIPGKPVVVACATGRRTPLAASVLGRQRELPVLRLAHGGISDLPKYGIALVGALLPTR